jgi:hypothetical protein
MDAIVAIVVCWVIGSLVIAELGPLLLEGASYLIRFLFICVGETLKLLALAACRSAQGVWSLTVFLFILADEWRRGPRAEEAEEELFGEEEQEEEQKQDAYGAALALLGLREPFAKADLKRVYRQAMKTAHTDAGGTNEAAVALNTARDLVMAVKGWK